MVLGKYFSMMILFLGISLSAFADEPKTPISKKNEFERSEQFKRDLEKYRKEFEEAYKKNRKKLGILTPEEEQEKKDKENQKKDRFYVFVSMESPDMDRILQYVYMFKKKNPNAFVHIDFLYDINDLIKLQTGPEEDGKDLMKKYPLTLSFLEKLNKTDISFPIPSSTILAKRFGIKNCPSIVYQPANSDQTYLWEGFIEFPKAKLSALEQR